MLEYDYDEYVALSVTTKAFQHLDPSITREDVRSTVKVVRAARTGNVDIAAKPGQMRLLAHVFAVRRVREPYHRSYHQALVPVVAHIGPQATGLVFPLPSSSTVIGVRCV